MINYNQLKYNAILIKLNFFIFGMEFDLTE